MSKVSGKNGYINISSSVVLGINQWNLDYTAEMLETTDFSASGVASYIPGVTRWSGAFSGYKDGLPLAIGTTSVSLQLAEAAATNWQGSAFISGIHANTNFDGIVSYAYDFQGTGALTTATA